MILSVHWKDMTSLNLPLSNLILSLSSPAFFSLSLLQEEFNLFLYQTVLIICAFEFIHSWECATPIILSSTGLFIQLSMRLFSSFPKHSQINPIYTIKIVILSVTFPTLFPFLRRGSFKNICCPIPCNSSTIFTLIACPQTLMT